jgi:hypothetical protein
MEPQLAMKMADLSLPFTHRLSNLSMSAWEYEAPTTMLASLPRGPEAFRWVLACLLFQKGDEDLRGSILAFDYRLGKGLILAIIGTHSERSNIQDKSVSKTA